METPEVSSIEEAVIIPPAPAPAANEPSMEDYAAKAYQVGMDKLYDKIEELSNAQLKRVVVAMLEYPFQDGTFMFKYQQEKELFEIGMKILDAKFVMIRAVLEMKKDEIQDLLGTKKEKEDESVSSGLRDSGRGEASSGDAIAADLAGGTGPGDSVQDGSQV